MNPTLRASLWEEEACPGADSQHLVLRSGPSRCSEVALAGGPELLRQLWAAVGKAGTWGPRAQRPLLAGTAAGGQAVAAGRAQGALERGSSPGGQRWAGRAGASSSHRPQLGSGGTITIESPALGLSRGDDGLGEGGVQDGRRPSPGLRSGKLMPASSEPGPRDRCGPPNKGDPNSL